MRSTTSLLPAKSIARSIRPKVHKDSGVKSLEDLFRQQVSYLLSHFFVALYFSVIY